MKDDQLDSGLDASTGAQDDKLASPDYSALKEQLKKELTSDLVSEFDKRYQSLKDKHLSNIDKEITGLKETMTKNLVAAGMTREEVESIIAERFGSTQPIESAGASSVATEAMKSVLDIAGITEDDPDVLTLSKRNLPYAQWVVELKNIVKARSAGVTSGSIQGVPGIGVPALSAENYRSEMLAARGKGPQEAARIRKKYFEAGVNIDEVAF